MRECLAEFAARLGYTNTRLGRTWLSLKPVSIRPASQLQALLTSILFRHQAFEAPSLVCLDTRACLRRAAGERIGRVVSYLVVFIGSFGTNRTTLSGPQSLGDEHKWSLEMQGLFCELEPIKKYRYAIRHQLPATAGNSCTVRSWRDVLHPGRCNIVVSRLERWTKISWVSLNRLTYRSEQCPPA